MIKKTVEYEDFNDKKVTEDLYFHIGMQRLVALETSVEGGVVEKIQAIQKSQNAMEMIAIFKQIICLGYGIRESDSKFRQTAEISEEFGNSLAYDALFTDLLSSGGAAVAEFITSMLPKDLANSPEMRAAVEDVKAGRTITKVEKPELVVDAIPDTESGLDVPRDGSGKLLAWAFRTPTKREQMAMTKNQLIDVMQRQAKGWTPPPQV